MAMHWNGARDFPAINRHSRPTQARTPLRAGRPNGGLSLAEAVMALPHWRHPRRHPGGGSPRWQGVGPGSFSGRLRLAVAGPPAPGPSFLPHAVFSHVQGWSTPCKLLPTAHKETDAIASFDLLFWCRFHLPAAGRHRALSCRSSSPSPSPSTPFFVFLVFFYFPFQQFPILL